MYKIKSWLCLGIFALSIVLYGCADEPLTGAAATVTELKIIDNKVGVGERVMTGNRVAVHYTGWLYDAAASDHKGKKFDSSLDRGKPFTFKLGAGQVIKGWDQGVSGMKIDGERTLIIPSELAYGARGAGGQIPPGATLVFDIKLLDVQ